MDDREYSLMEHLSELRVRLFKALIGVAIIAIAAFFVSDNLLTILRAPMETVMQARYGASAHFVTTGAAEYFVCQMKAALVAGLFIASPWVLYQIWSFIAPGLYDHEKKYAVWFVWAGAFFFCAGAVFSYFFVFPPMYTFFVTQQPADVVMLPSLEENFGFTLKLLVSFGAVFETPVVIFILSIAGIIDPNTLYKYRRYVVVLAFIIGAVLTPSPDVYSQCLMALPLLALYELGVLVSRIAVKMKGTPLSRKERAVVEAQKKAGAAPPQDPPT
ncbi:MAG TPA: twin-arginine translocase subunit TatC [Myxococcota bacterium]